MWRWRGYYGNTDAGGENNSGSEANNEAVKTAAGVVLSMSKHELNAKGDTVTVTAKALDKNNGGVANTTIELHIKDGLENGATSDTSRIVTNEKGEAVFTINLDGRNPNLEELYFTATIVGTKISDVKKIAVSGVSTIVQSQYELKFDPVSALQVTGGEAEIKVRAIDLNGGGVPNENVHLKLSKEMQSIGVSIAGLSSSVTDNEGYATFKIKLEKGKEAERSELIKSGIDLEAVLIESSGAKKTQVTNVTVNSVKNMVSELSIHTANNKIDAINGTLTVVVKAVNPEGNAVEGEYVSLSLDPEAKKLGAELTNDKVKTNSKGEAIFTIKTALNKDNPDGIKLINNGITLKAVLTKDNTVSTQETKITVVAPASAIISHLSISQPNNIDISGGKVSVVVTAIDKNGGTLENKKISLVIPNSVKNGLRVEGGTSLTTDENGQAKFNIVFDKSGVSQDVIDDLLRNGVRVTAKESESSKSQEVQIRFNSSIDIKEEVQRINVIATKGVVAAKGDSVHVVAQVINNAGGFAEGKEVSFSFEGKQSDYGVTFDGAPKLITDANGQVSFTLTTNASNSEMIKQLVDLGISVKMETKLADGTVVSGVTKIMVEPSAALVAEVSYLKVAEQDVIEITDSTKRTLISVDAFKGDGKPVASKDISLRFDKNYAAIKVIANTKTTDTSGRAIFDVEIDPSKLTAADKKELVEKGLSLSVHHEGIEQRTKLNFFVKAVEVHRMDLVTDKPVLVATVDDPKEIKVSVTLKDEKGRPIQNRNVNLELAKREQGNNSDTNILTRTVNFKGVIGGLTTVTTDANGQATVDIIVEAKNQTDLNDLIKSGIKVIAVANGEGRDKIQETTINVLSQVVESEVASLHINNAIDILPTSGGQATIKVKALTARGDVAKGKEIAFKLLDVPLGMDITLDSAKKTTNNAGEVDFIVTYNAHPNLTPTQIKAFLLGIKAEAIYTNNSLRIAQTVIIQTTVSNATLQNDVQRLELTTSKGIVRADDDIFTFSARVIGQNGSPLENKFVGVGLDNASFENGVSFDGPQQLKTDNNGYAEFKIKVKGDNKAKIENLVNNGITLAASVTQSDGSTITQSTRVMVQQPEQVLISKLSPLASHPSISVLGGTSVIGVTAVDANNKPLANREVFFALSSNTSSRVTVNQKSAFTNDQGIAYFEVTVSDGGLDTALTEKGITYAVTAYNEAQRIPVSQVGKINIDALDATNLSVRSTKLELLSQGDTVEIEAVLLDAQANPISSYPVTLTVMDVDARKVATINDKPSSTTITDNEGIAKFSLALETITPELLEKLLVDGIQVKAAIMLPNGQSLEKLLNFTIEQVENPYQIDSNIVILGNKDFLNVNGDRSIVRVRLTKNGQPAKNQDLSLSVRKTASTTGKNIGFITEDNTSDENNHPLPENIADKWTVKTDEDGYGYFSLYIPNAGFDKDALIAAGITLDAENITDGVAVKQVRRIAVQDPTSSAPRYRLDIQPNNSTINVVDGTVDVTVKLIDQYGGHVSGEYITLKLDSMPSQGSDNGARILGASGKVTDGNGEAVFTVKLDERLRQNYTASQFINADLKVFASFASAEQEVILDVVKKDSSSISINISPTNPQPIANGVKYEQKLKAVVKDSSGNLLANQSVNFSITPMQYLRGQNIWAKAPRDPESASAPFGISKWIFSGASYYKDVMDKDTLVVNSVRGCKFAVGATTVTNLDIPLDVTKFTSNDATTWTGTTNNSGEIDFTVNYPKNYANWLDIRIDASTESYKMMNSYDYRLKRLESSYDDVNGTFEGIRMLSQPSPFGTETRECTP